MSNKYLNAHDESATELMEVFGLTPNSGVIDISFTLAASEFAATVNVVRYVTKEEGTKMCKFLKRYRLQEIEEGGE